MAPRESLPSQSCWHANPHFLFDGLLVTRRTFVVTTLLELIQQATKKKKYATDWSLTASEQELCLLQGEDAERLDPAVLLVLDFREIEVEKVAEARGVKEH